MSRTSSKSRRSKRSKAETTPRPRNRRLDADDVMVAEKVASRGRKPKNGRKGKAKETAADRREERRLQREARRAEKEQARQERRSRWEARLSVLQDPRVKQTSGIVAAVALGGFMALAGISALFVGGADIRLLLTETVPGSGSYSNWLGALGPSGPLLSCAAASASQHPSSGCGWSLPGSSNLRRRAPWRWAGLSAAFSLPPFCCHGRRAC